MIDKILDGRYQITKALSKGGFGETFLAKDVKRPGNPVCIVKKLHSSHENTEFLKVAGGLFKKEAAILKKLGKHDKVPTLLADIEEGQDFYLVEQFIPGNTLNQEILAGKSWSEFTVISFLKEILTILHFVHSQGVIHRDIKPENIIRRTSDRKLVLIDFGAVKEIGTQIHQGQINLTITIGTPGYIPIEQTQGSPQFNSDIYALGKIAIQALLGLNIQQLINLKDPSNPSMGEIIWENRKKISPKLANIINKMVRCDYSQRYHSANEVLADLEKITAGAKSNKEISNTNTSTNTKSGIFRTLLPQTPKPKTLVFAGLGILGVIGISVGVVWSQSKAIAEYFDRQGVTKGQKGEHKAALADFNRAIWFNSKDPIIYKNKGTAHFTLKDYGGAIEDFTKVIELDPNNALGYHKRGLVYSSSKHKQRAIADYTRAIQIDPKLFVAYLMRGNDRFYMGDSQGAVSDYTKVIELKPDFAEAYIDRCNLYKQIHEFKKAIGDCDKAISLSPQNFAAYNNRGNLLREIGDYQGAIADFSKGININPNAIQLYNNRGHVYSLGLKDYKKAIEDYNQVIKRNKKSAAGYLNRGAARFGIGDTQGAIADASKAIELKSDFAQGYLNRGEYRAKLGKEQAAIKDFQQAAKFCGERGWTDCYKKSQQFIKGLKKES
ncbi:MAG: tetratricopeptide repeat protein [Cyanobacteria bacterium J06639_18]